MQSARILPVNGLVRYAILCTLHTVCDNAALSVRHDTLFATTLRCDVRRRLVEIPNVSKRKRFRTVSPMATPGGDAAARGGESTAPAGTVELKVCTACRVTGSLVPCAANAVCLLPSSCRESARPRSRGLLRTSRG
jgi:hypothetical protein